MSSASIGGTEGCSPASSPASAASLTMAAPKFGTLVPNRIFVGGISANTSEAELAQLFSAYGKVKATKIILDRGGVSKGYGFVTFETEEEAKRLQQESECIVLRERKLNIAPAIKKQPFNRSFDGGPGSPASVPTNTYYYPNGMGLTYQNGMTFYNTTAPAPGTTLGPPTDPTTIYQAGVFGPQATSGHQTFAPMMYPCPAPSLYMPQQYPYSPIPYEPYYANATATGAPQYLCTTGSSQNNTTSGGNSTGSGNNGTGATSPPTGPPPPLPSMPPPPPAHFYSPAAPPPHHHPPVPAGPPPLQMDHLYCSFAAGPPPPSHASMGLTDQQLILYTSDSPCHQASTSDSQTAAQEDSHSTSSLSEQPHGETPTASVSATPLVPLMPVKFPGRYSNYHPITIHTANLHSSQTCMNDTDDCASNQLHCRAIVYHPAAVYIPHTHTTSFHNSAASNASLIPTLSSASQQQSLDTCIKASNLTQRDYCKTSTSGQNNYAKSQNPNISFSYQTTFTKGQNRNPSVGNKYGTVDSFHKCQTLSMTSSNRLPVHYKRATNSGSSACFLTPKSNYAFGQNSQKPGINSCYSSHPVFSNQSYTSVCCSTQKNVKQNFEYTNGRGRSYECFDNGIYGKSMSNVSAKRNSSNYRCSSVSNAHYDNNLTDQSGSNYTSRIDSSAASPPSTQTLHSTESSDKPTSPPPAPYSPMTRPLPNISPPASQVQLYGPAQSHYQPSMTSPQQQQQQQHFTQRRYAVSSTLSSIRKSSERCVSAGSQTTVLKQPKYKVNGIMQTGGKVKEENLGGAGDAPPAVAKLPPTPPSTPRTHPGHIATNDQNQLSDTCHQIQALTL